MTESAQLFDMDELQRVPCYSPVYPVLTTGMTDDERGKFQDAIMDLVMILDKNKNKRDAVEKFFMGFAALGLPEDVYEQELLKLRRIFELERDKYCPPMLLDSNIFPLPAKDRLGFLSSHMLINGLLDGEFSIEQLLQAQHDVLAWRRTHQHLPKVPVGQTLWKLSDDGLSLEE